MQGDQQKKSIMDVFGTLDLGGKPLVDVREVRDQIREERAKEEMEKLHRGYSQEE